MACPTGRTWAHCLVLGALLLATLAIALLPAPAQARSKRLRPPPNVLLHPDRGMTFGRLSKIEHDQRAFKPLNQGTRLPKIDPAIDPYQPAVRPNVYDPQTGVIRGSLSDALRAVRRGEDLTKRSREASRGATAVRSANAKPPQQEASAGTVGPGSPRAASR